MQYNIEENSILFFTYCDFHPLILEKHDTDSNGFFFFFIPVIYSRKINKPIKSKIKMQYNIERIWDSISLTHPLALISP
jgi:hypothetical protein